MRRARARGGLRVLELVDVELERNPLALHAVELGRQAAALVRLGEDQLRPLEGAVVLRELLHGLDEDPLALLGLAFIVQERGSNWTATDDEISRYFALEHIDDV